MYFQILTLLLLLPTPIQCSEKLLLDLLLEGYSPYVRPVVHQDQPVILTFGLEIIHVVSIVESTQTIKVKAWLRMSWKNELLTWEPSAWGYINSTRLSAESVWTPDLFLVEDVSEELSSGSERYKTLVNMHADGTHYWYVPVLIDSSCLFDVTSFPFDRQECKFKFMSWTMDQTELDMKQDNKPIITEHNYVKSTSWTMHDTSAKVVSQKYQCCPNPYVHIEYMVQLHRQPHYYFYNVVIPCIIQMMIILFTFFLPPDSGERIGVAITVLLVFAVYLEVLSTALPKSSSSAPALSRFYLAAMCGSAFSIIATCFVLVIHFKGAEKGIGPMPRWVKDIFLKRFAVFLCVRQNLRVHKDEELLALEKHGSYSELKTDENHIQKKESGIDNKTMASQFSVTSEVNMEKLLDEVRVITALIHDQNLQDEIEEEWQILAKVFDRLFFIVFLLIFVISSLVILLPVYHAHLE